MPKVGGNRVNGLLRVDRKIAVLESTQRLSAAAKRDARRIRLGVCNTGLSKFWSSWSSIGQEGANANLRRLPSKHGTTQGYNTLSGGR